MLQVSVLTDQVEAQGDKIRDLESSIVDPGGKFTKGAKNAANQHVSSQIVVCSRGKLKNPRK